VSGRVDEVIFLGSHTRLVVQLDVGVRFLVVLQNGAAEAAADEDLTGTEVQLTWARQHNRTIGDRITSKGVDTLEKGGA
jgi:hypothetical protein